MKTINRIRAFADRFRAATRRPAHPAVRRAAFETLEGRQLLSAAPNFIAIADGTQNFGDTRRAVNYYDVSNLTSSSTNYFNQTPSLTLWTGYEITNTTGGATGRNFEEISGLDVNPANGDTYVLSFDSGPTGVADPVGDTQGDYDLYRYNFTKAYSDLVSASRGAGIMYTDTTTPDYNAATGTGVNYQTAYGGRTNGPTGLPSVTSADAGVPDGRSNADADPSNDFFWIDGLIDKTGEVARVGGSSSPFFDQQDIQFVSAEKILLMENTTGADPDGTGPRGIEGSLSQDYQIRTLERVSTTSGAATVSGTTGGYNGGTSESWQSYQWTGDNFVDMDNIAARPNNLSEIDGMRYVERDGTRGVWVSDRDGGGDDFSFFELDFATRTAEKQEFAGTTDTGFALDESPTANDNTGDLDFFDVDEAGTLTIGESGFFDTPKTEPNIQTLTVDDYTAGDSQPNGRSEVDLGTWAVEPDIAPTSDDDTAVTDGRFAVLNRGQDRVYYFDIDSGSLPGVVADVYVYDLNTNTLIYQELNAANHFFIDANKIRAFTLGDYAITGGSFTSRDGVANQADIDALYDRIADPTVGGKFSAAVGREMFDLTGDNLLTGGNPTGVRTITGDVDYLVRRVLATEYGDVDLNRTLNSDDRDIITLNLGTSGGWARGDLDGSDTVNTDDRDIFDVNVIANPNPVRV